MKIAVLGTISGNLRQAYPHDYEGREHPTHLQRAKKALEERGHKARIIDATPKSIIGLKGFDVVVNFCDEFLCSPLFEPHAAALLDMTEIPYTGNDYFALALCLNKPFTKKVLLQNKIETPQYQVFDTAMGKPDSGMTFPMIVKPARQDASIGIRNNAVVRTPAQLKRKVVEVITKYGQPALVEEYVEGREFSVAVLGCGDKLNALPISEIDFSRLPAQYEKICSYEAKWETRSELFKRTPPVCPANVDGWLRQKLIAAAKAAYAVTNCRDYARIDFRVDSKGKPYVLEVNPNPDLSDDAGLANMAQKSGLGYGDLLLTLIAICIERNRKWTMGQGRQSNS
jgi:D-alanine-D-alanine ligase